MNKLLISVLMAAVLPAGALAQAPGPTSRSPWSCRSAPAAASMPRRAS